jgi:hypothetical protein
MQGQKLTMLTFQKLKLFKPISTSALKLVNIEIGTP